MRLIDADALKDKVIHESNRLGSYGYMDTKSIIDLIDDVPTIEPEPQWIPVTERLPKEERKSYWVCTDAEYQCECRWTNASPLWGLLTDEWHWNIFDLPQYTKVVAWMPLPEPWKGEDE